MQPLSPPEDEETFGRRLARAREGRGLKARAVAEALGIAATTLSQWENDHRRPDVDQLTAICAVLHVSADVLLFRQAFQLGPTPRETEMVRLRVAIEQAKLDVLAAVADLGLAENGAPSFIADAREHLTAALAALDVHPTAGDP